MPEDSIQSIRARHLEGMRLLEAGDYNGVIAVLTEAIASSPKHVGLAGLFKGSIILGGGNLSSLGGTDIFLAKLDANGKPLWSQRFGDPSAQAAHGVAVDPSGNVMMAGSYEGNLNFGGGNLGRAGGIDAFVVMVDSDGNHRWSKHFGDSESQVATGVAVDPSGDVVVAGWFQGTVNFGDGPLSAADSKDVFLAKLSGSGKSSP